MGDLGNYFPLDLPVFPSTGHGLPGGGQRLADENARKMGEKSAVENSENILRKIV